MPEISRFYGIIIAYTGRITIHLMFILLMVITSVA